MPVGEFVGNNEAAFSELKEMIEKAEVVHQDFSTDGSVTVTIQMSMNGGFSQLMLPTRIKQIEPVKPREIRTISTKIEWSLGSNGNTTATLMLDNKIIDEFTIYR